MALQWNHRAQLVRTMCFASLLATTAVLAEYQTIRNDQFWKTSSGGIIYSQGGGIIKVGDTYYWYGVKYNGAVAYAAKPTGKNSDFSFAGVTCYSSKDLVNWKDEGLALATDQVGGSWFGRLGVVFNANTKQYVMIAQGTSTSGASGNYFATSSTPDGPFKFNRVQTDMPFFVNGGTGDQTTFQDDDGKAYVICSSASGRSNLYVAPLRASDFLAIDPNPSRVFRGAGREGNALFKHDGTYYFCSSDLHGWNSSHTYCISSKNILGPYGAEFVMDGTDADFSHVTQTGFFVSVAGTQQSTVIFAGDRWSDFAGNGLGYNQWMPLSFTSGKPSMNSFSEWDLDAQTGAWKAGAGNNWILNPSFEADRVSQSSLAGWSDSTDQSSFPGGNISGGRTGRWALNFSSASAYRAKKSQSLKGLLAGSYTLSAWVRSSGGQKSLAVFTKTPDGKEYPLNVSGSIPDWKLFTLSGIPVQNGNVEVGIRAIANGGNWSRVDDLSLVRQSSSTTDRNQPTMSAARWHQTRDRIEIESEVAGTLTLSDPSGRTLGSVSGSGVLGMKLDGESGLVVASFRDKAGKASSRILRVIH